MILQEHCGKPLEITDCRELSVAKVASLVRGRVHSSIVWDLVANLSKLPSLRMEFETADFEVWRTGNRLELYDRRLIRHVVIWGVNDRCDKCGDSAEAISYEAGPEFKTLCGHHYRISELERSLKGLDNDDCSGR